MGAGLCMTGRHRPAKTRRARGQACDPKHSPALKEVGLEGKVSHVVDGYASGIGAIGQRLIWQCRVQAQQKRMVRGCLQNASSCCQNYDY
eukprot:scaffold324526_cov45-Prasinocladus_malaysianus.AAC.2